LKEKQRQKKFLMQLNHTSRKI